MTVYFFEEKIPRYLLTLGILFILTKNVPKILYGLCFGDGGGGLISIDFGKTID